MKKNAIGVLLALALTGVAHAGTYSNDYFTVTYDDSFWAGANVSWNANSGTLRFGDLVDQWGLVASAKSLKDVSKTDSTGKYWNDMLTVTAKSGYVLSSVDTGIRGVTFASANVPSTDGYEAYAGGSVQADWALEANQYSWSSAGAGAAAAKSVSSDGGHYDVSGIASFSGGNAGGPEAAMMMAPQAGSANGAGSATATLSSLWAGVYAETYGTGSSARATINQVYFTVQTAPVPEPETYAMLLAGLGILGAVARRRSCPL